MIARRAALGVCLGVGLALSAVGASAAPVAGIGSAGARASAIAPLAAEEQCTASTRLTTPPPALDVLQSELAWGVTRGEGIVVAVVDSGVAASNPHLQGIIQGGVNLVPDGTDPAGTTDTYGHGTAVAGQIAAQRIEGSEVVGLAPGVRILPVRVFAGTDDQQMQAGFGPSTARLADGIRYAADTGARIINVSMSTSQNDPALADAVAYATGRGALVVGSSGNRDSTLGVEKNDGDGARYPAGDASAIGVAATTIAGDATDASIHGPHVSIAAPGAQIVTASSAGGDCIFAGDSPATSFAAAYVSAAAALVAAAHPDETPAQWKYRLEASAARGNPDARDDASGWGIVQPYDAIVLRPGAGIRGPVSPFTTSDRTEPTPTPVPAIAVTEGVGPQAAAIAWGTAIGIGALTLLGAAAAIGVLARRRRGDEELGTDRPRAGGLYARIDGGTEVQG